MKICGLEIQTFDDFDAKYKLDTSSLSKVMCSDSQKGMFETYGPDREHILSLDESVVWSAIDGEYGLTYVPGFQNGAVYHMVTTEPWASLDDQYVYESDLYELKEEIQGGVEQLRRMICGQLLGLKFIKKELSNGNCGFVICGEKSRYKNLPIYKNSKLDSTFKKTIESLCSANNMNIVDLGPQGGLVVLLNLSQVAA
jgi:hypothetical protein